MKTAKELIKLAEAEIGYVEKKSNSNLDSKTANPGRGNFTKYARDLYGAGFFNGNKNGYPWCAVFVNWLFWKLCGENRILAIELTCQSGPYGAGCIWGARYYRNAGRFFKTPEIGDQIFFGKEGDEGHTGIVVAVDSERVHTIEGNTSSSSGVISNGGEVCRKSYVLNSPDIAGYGRPLYGKDTTAETKKESATNGDSSVCIELSVLKNGAEGEQVKTLQRLLTALGYRLPLYGIDGNFGDETESAVRTFQKIEKIDIDGSVGKQTWTKLLKG